MKSERYLKGKTRLAEIGDKSPIFDDLQVVAPDLVTWIHEFAFGDVHSRPGLSVRDRELVIISALAAMGCTLPELKNHIVTGLHVGLTPREISEALMQLVVYCGFPIAIAALRATKEVFDDEGIRVLMEPSKNHGFSTSPTAEK
jgi:4-carboxymuconolactone decarboxylase